MTDPNYVNLQPSEQAVLMAASQIYAAYIQSGAAKEDPEALMRHSVVEAIQLARMVDDHVIAPGEMS